MEAIKSECPTDVLVDLSDAISCINAETTSSIPHLKNKAALNIGVTSDKNCEDQSILNLSSSRIYEELVDFKLKADAVKEPKLNEVNNDCPTGILIDVPCSQSFHLNERNEHAQSDLDSERKCSFSFEKKYSREDSDNIAPSPTKENDQMLNSRLRWKTPSPKSMSRISKEASKIIQHLNSSDIFNEDDLLTEEMLPIPINFDSFDTDDTSNEKKTLSSNIISDKVNHELSVNVQIQDAVNDKAIQEEGIDSCDIDNNSPHNVLSNNSNERCVQSPSKTHIEMNTKNSKDEECDKREINLSTESDCVDDVFITTCVSAEDKENIPRKGNKVTLLKKKTIGNKPLSPFTPNKKSDYHGTLKNVSNIKREINSSPKYLKSSLDKKENTPLKKIGIGLKAKTVQPLPLKSKIKRTVLSDTSDQKLNTTIKDFSFMSKPVCNSSSSAARQQNACPEIKTPLRRYSVCTPLKRPSSVNPVTPSLFQNCDKSRFTPQSARASLSFSRSCQQFSKPFSVVKNQNSALSTVSVGNVRESLGRINSAKKEVPSFSKSTSSISFQSLKRNSMYSSSKDKFCSKLTLPSPLPAEQEKKIVRALFPSASSKRKN